MPQTNPTLISKLQVYRKILAQEFIREFNFLIDEAAGRATAKGDFTDKLIGVFKMSTSHALGNLSTQGMNLIDTAIGISIDWVNDLRKEGGREYVNDQDVKIDHEQLRILLECVVAIKASHMYSFAIDAYLSDSPMEAVVPLAKTHTERMLEYVIRKCLPLTEENLLTGIIAGHSGAYVNDFTNTSLISKENPKAKLTAEGLSGRAAYMTSNGKFYLLVPPKSKNETEPYHKQPLHKRLPPNQMGSFFQGLIEKIGYKKETLYKYGYSKIIKQKQMSNSIILEPKYGYLKVTNAVVRQFDYAEQPQNTLSPSLMSKLQQHIPTIQTITCQQIIDYLTHYKNQISLHDFIRKTQPNFTLLMLEVETAQDLDFTHYDFSGADLSDCILNNIKISGSIVGTKFQRSYLVGADLSDINNAEKADFTDAHMENINAQNANLSGAILVHTQLHFANLQEANLQRVQHLGAVWINANLEKIITDDPSAILEQQKEQYACLQDQMHQVRTEIQTQNKAIDEIQALIKSLDQRFASENNTMAAQAEQLQSILGELVQEKQNRLAFERYCYAEFSELKDQTQGSDEKLSAQQEQIQHLEKRVEKLEQSYREHDKLIKIILEKLEPKAQSNTFLVQQLKTQPDQFDQLKQDVHENSTIIEKQQQEIRALKKEIRQQLQELRGSSREQQKQLTEITDQARILANNLTKSNIDKTDLTNNLSKLANKVDGYVSEKNKKIDKIYYHLQQLKNSVEQIQRKNTTAPSISNNDLYYAHEVPEQIAQSQKISTIEQALKYGEFGFDSNYWAIFYRSSQLNEKQINFDAIFSELQYTIIPNLISAEKNDNIDERSLKLPPILNYSIVDIFPNHRNVQVESATSKKYPFRALTFHSDSEVVSVDYLDDNLRNYISTNRLLKELKINPPSNANATINQALEKAASDRSHQTGFDIKCSSIKGRLVEGGLLKVYYRYNSKSIIEIDTSLILSALQKYITCSAYGEKVITYNLHTEAYLSGHDYRYDQYPYGQEDDSCNLTIEMELFEHAKELQKFLENGILNKQFCLQKKPSYKPGYNQDSRNDNNQNEDSERRYDKGLRKNPTSFHPKRGSATPTAYRGRGSNGNSERDRISANARSLNPKVMFPRERNMPRAESLDEQPGYTYRKGMSYEQ